MKVGDKVRIGKRLFRAWKRSWASMPQVERKIRVGYYSGPFEITDVLRGDGWEVAIIKNRDCSEACSLGITPSNTWSMHTHELVLADEYGPGSGCHGCAWEPCGKHK